MNNIKIIKFNLFKEWKMENELEKIKNNEHYTALGGVGIVKKIWNFCLIKTCLWIEFG